MWYFVCNGLLIKCDATGSLIAVLMIFTHVELLDYLKRNLACLEFALR